MASEGLFLRIKLIIRGKNNLVVRVQEKFQGLQEERHGKHGRKNSLGKKGLALGASTSWSFNIGQQPGDQARKCSCPYSAVYSCPTHLQ